MSKKIFVIYPEETREKTQEMIFARTQLVRAEIDLAQTEKDLKNLIAMFENIEGPDSKYKIDEAKLTVGLTKDEEGKLQASVAAGFFSFVKGLVGGEVGERISENKLFEITIKRKAD